MESVAITEKGADNGSLAWDVRLERRWIGIGVLFRKLDARGVVTLSPCR